MEGLALTGKQEIVISREEIKEGWTTSKGANHVENPELNTANRFAEISAAAKKQAVLEDLVARGLVQERDGYGEVLFPAHVDGNAPEKRTPVQDVDVSDVLKGWD